MSAPRQAGVPAEGADERRERIRGGRLTSVRVPAVTPAAACVALFPPVVNGGSDRSRRFLAIHTLAVGMLHCMHATASRSYGFGSSIYDDVRGDRHACMAYWHMAAMQYLPHEIKVVRTPPRVRSTYYTHSRLPLVIVARLWHPRDRLPPLSIAPPLDKG